MTTRTNIYLTFRDNAKEVMAFYHSVFGGELTSSTFAEFHASDDPADQDKIMHSQLTTPTGIVLMAADTPSHMDLTVGNNAAISISSDAEDEAEVRGYFDALSEGGTAGVPLEKAPWGDYFGMFTDKFGVPWLVNIAGPTS